MFKPTKPQHIANKAYVDNNSGGGGGTTSGNVFLELVRESGTERHINKTYEEIKNYIDAGQMVFLKIGDYNGLNIYQLDFFMYDETAEHGGFGIGFNNLGWSFNYGDSKTDYPTEDLG